MKPSADDGGSSGKMAAASPFSDTAPGVVPGVDACAGLGLFDLEMERTDEVEESM